MIELRHDINISQKLQMTLAPRLLEMLKMLNLPFCELLDKINKEAEENPVMEIERPEMLLEYMKYLSSDRKTKKEVDYTEYDGLKNVSAKSVDLRAHLLEQLKLTDLAGREESIAQQLIDQIDQRGYLEKDFKADGKKDEVEKVLAVIQAFEPDGVGARDLKESLLIQIREYSFDDPEIEGLLTKVVTDHLDALGRGEHKEIALTEGVLEEDILEIANFIKDNLTPYPATGFSQKERLVVPSFAIEIQNDDIKVTNLEERYGPKIRVSPDYQKMLRDPRTDAKTVKFLKERLDKTMDIIENLAKRQETGSKIMEMITQRQDAFLKKGQNYFRPLLQTEIARELGLHPSTISRAIAEKYVQTPRGLYSLKYLCPRKLSGFSAFEIKSRIRDLISAEDSKKPFSDTALLDKLMGEGVRISRRTVSAFRSELGIKSSRERKG
ncbi:MAG: RNA polymerase factor sigma-54 [Candidatus Saganbacteria bacterium]|nr:RNA polymerase factor sigma-54 [Candidatus Saganbacteria bacterium]